MVAILFDNKKRLPAVVAVAMAKRAFREAVHTQGETARVVVFNPEQAPEDAEVGGLTVYTDREVPVNRIRVATEYVPSRQEKPELVEAQSPQGGYGSL
jgi:hypothetical protein